MSLCDDYRAGQSRVDVSVKPKLICMFHMNLAFSSLRPEGRADVVQRCYWPMLELASTTPFPIAVESTGWTLEQVAAIDPRWISRASELIEEGQLELVGSAYAQCAAPLLPAEMNRWNLQLGLASYEELLGVRPSIALICEQAYSPGLVDLYLEAGYEGIIADWENAYRSHADWDPGRRRYPQRARGTSSSIPLIWSESIAFQKFQRFAHGEMSLDRYTEFVAGEVSGSSGALVLYANDAEVFDHRPGRFAAEPELQAGEWDRIADGLRSLVARGVGEPALPSEVLTMLANPEAGEELSLEAADQPIPVKKQDKYNVARWAITGRDDIGINTRCWRVYESMRSKDVQDPDAWRVLCELWASDYRTHITDDRWEAMLRVLSEQEERWGVSAPVKAPQSATGLDPLPEGVSREGDLLRIRTGPLDVALNLRRGMAIESFRDSRVSQESLFGTIEHGYFPTIELGADWYSGNLVQEAPLCHKVTDLSPVEPIAERLTDDSVRVSCSVLTALGTVDKHLLIRPEGTLELDVTMRWPELPPGSLRVAHVTLNPAAYDQANLWFAAHNGGSELEVNRLSGELAFDHGAAVSALVSIRQGLGLTEGVLLIGDSERLVRIEVDQSISKPLGLIRYQPLPHSFFVRASFSLAEGDDTRRGPIGRSPDNPQRLRVRISAELAGS